MIDKDSAKFWWPRLASHPWEWFREFLPPTFFVNYDEVALSPALHGHQNEAYNALYYEVEAAIKLHLGYPVFIRTDITSAKHAGRAAWWLDSEEDLNQALLLTLSCSQLKTYFEKVKASAIMIRPLLKVKADRTAFNGLPIGNEVRIFANAEGVLCHHSYWPEEALDGYMDDSKPFKYETKDWATGWTPTDILDAAVQAAKQMDGGDWSIDFMQDATGKWWLMDMATAPNSYHWPGCPRLDKSCVL